MHLTSLLYISLFSCMASAATIPKSGHYNYFAKRLFNESAETTTLSTEAELTTLVTTEPDGEELTTIYTLTSTVFVTLKDLTTTSSISLYSTDDEQGSTTARLTTVPTTVTPSITSAPVTSTNTENISTSAGILPISNLVADLKSVGKDAEASDIVSILGSSVLFSTCPEPSTVTVTVTASSSLPTDLTYSSDLQLQRVTILSTNVGTTLITIPVTATFIITNGSSMSYYTASSMIATVLEQTSIETITSTYTITSTSTSSSAATTSANDGTSYFTTTITSTEYSTLLSGTSGHQNGSYSIPQISASIVDTTTSLAKRGFLW